MTTISARMHAARRRLEEAGIPADEATLDARLLAKHVLGWDSARILTDATGPEPIGFAQQFEALVARRSRREPTAYVTGSREFWNLTFTVTPAVLIPRPETEGIVEAFLELFPTHHAPVRVADVGTGSGCIAVAAASERPRARVVATDLSPAALAVAQQNAARHSVASRVHCARSNLLTGLQGGFDAVLSNPPYVPSGVKASLQPEVREFEPALALFAGTDGADVMRQLAVEAAEKLRFGGYLVFEFGDGQEPIVGELISRTAGLTMVAVRCDLRGIPRVAIARRMEPGT